MNMKSLVFLIFAIFNNAIETATCYTQDGYIAAISEKYLDDVIRYSRDRDAVAVNKLIAAGVAVRMKKGIKVFVVNTHVFGGKVEFRVPGETTVLWTITEAIKC